MPPAEAGTDVSNNRPALGERLADLAELGAIEFRPEPLDTIVKRRLKAIWTARSCPNCGEDSLQALDDSHESGVVAVTGKLRTAGNTVLRFGTRPGGRPAVRGG